jgi:ABC-type phosphate transport system substrate-binding protein
MKRLNLSLKACCASLGLLMLLCTAQVHAQNTSATNAATADRDALVLIGHASVPRLDATTVQRLFSGRVVEVGGVAIVPVNATSGSKARARFMANVMAMDEEKYVAYWTVRKHVGKGTPPQELKTAAEVMDFVQNTPGALGYVTVGDLRPNMNVVLRP